MIAPIDTTMPAFEGLFDSVLSGQIGLRRREKEAYTLMAFESHLVLVNQRLICREGFRNKCGCADDCRTFYHISFFKLT